MNIFTSFVTITDHPNNRKKKLKTLFRLLWWKCNQIFFKVPAIIEISKSRKMVCYPDSSYGSFVVYTLEPEFAELRFMSSYLKNSDTVIDVGSHIGHYILLASEVVTKGRLIAFEPTSANCNRIRENITLNQLEDKVVLEEKAVSNKNGRARFLVTAESEVNRLSNDKDTKENTVNVPVISLDSYCKKNRIVSIEFLKIDTEGAEADVLLGAADLLSESAIKILLLELNPKVDEYRTKRQIIFQLLLKYEYDFYLLDDNNRWVKTKPTNIYPKNTVNILAVAKNKQTKLRAKKAFRI